MVHVTCTTVLLAATCLLLSQDVVTETVTTCEVETIHSLSCDIGVIRVYEALYGRADSVTCGDGRPPGQLADTTCSQDGTVDVLKRRCDGRIVCDVRVSDFGSPDPCTGTYKYLQTKYTCLPAIHQVTCEHSFASLQCDEGNLIFVIGAHYGRHDRTTCISQRPESQIQNIDCSRQQASKVFESCDGKNGCVIKAGNSVFGDPCYGTFKYLEVAYICEKDTGFEVSPDEVEPSVGGADDQTDAIPMSSSSDSLSTSDEPDARATLPTPCDILVSYSTFPGYVSWRDTQSGSWYVETLDRILEENASTDDLVTMLMMLIMGDPSFGSGGSFILTGHLQPGLTKTMVHVTCTTVLLAATCLLLSQDVVTETVTTCEVETIHSLSCDIGVIRVYEALYGRADSVTCGDGRPPGQLADTTCSQDGTVDVLKRRCDGRIVCDVRVSDFGSPDPCTGTYKYLQTKYTCLPAIHQVTCEHSFASLQCDEGNLIFVIGAHYGRHDRTTCISQRPESQIQNIDCSRQQASKVFESCDGKNGCVIKASNSVFGDPCYGTFKYLEVAYICKCG
ncbi:LOW QUALITY PROTEIN: uncharacterized protein LOC115011016 [Cottoperca gobio]|uniref:LOW QUALITY PROTEIN: uncharacterized protein LOC115011016 n=1 Tax=Cottoperca gobio TaxID=56716 RepID=A0A6J2Q007_COTGO|nr:LOW QUALITY PROTEIN: uncharacterized protein LOC115011016 [Cottoperca gobio]